MIWLLPSAALICSQTASDAQSLALVQAAELQIGVTRSYDSRYVKLPYPNGDVPLDRGVCTDVLIRAYRRLGVDLQKLVHEDIKAAWSSYPNPWKAKGPDRNIDHRRVPNLATFLQRKQAALPVSADPRDYRPGDVVTWRLANGLPHIGIVSATLGSQGFPLVIHNIGDGTKREDRLFYYPITGHYRYLP